VLIHWCRCAPSDSGVQRNGGLNAIDRVAGFVDLVELAIQHELFFDDNETGGVVTECTGRAGDMAALPLLKRFFVTISLRLHDDPVQVLAR
jgi:hypothetical protein